MQKKTIIISLATLLAVAGAGIGFYLFQGQDNANLAQEDTQDSSTLSPQEQADAELKKELADVPLLKPVDGEEFRVAKVIKAVNNSAPQEPNSPSKLGDQVDSSKYQGVVVKTSGKKAKTLVGKLSDKSKGVIEMRDTFELMFSDFPQLRLDVAEPNVIDIDTTKVIEWANLSADNRMVEAIRRYKKSQ